MQYYLFSTQYINQIKQHLKYYSMEPFQKSQQVHILKWLWIQSLSCDKEWAEILHLFLFVSQLYWIECLLQVFYFPFTFYYKAISLHVHIIILILFRKYWYSFNLIALICKWHLTWDLYFVFSVRRKTVQIHQEIQGACMKIKWYEKLLYLRGRVRTIKSSYHSTSRIHLVII